MHQVIVTLDGSESRDMDSFHTVCARVFGFPKFYGRSMNAWIDCLTYRDDDDGTSKVNVEPGGAIVIQVKNDRDLDDRCPEVTEALNSCVAFVNYRRIEVGAPAILFLSYHD
ncbi:MAG: barstar family protein [Planctomycetota bacterium]